MKKTKGGGTVRYDENRDVYMLGGREFIFCARTGIGESLSPDGEEPGCRGIPASVISRECGQTEEKTLLLNAAVDDLHFEISLSALTATDSFVFGRKTGKDPGKPTKDELAQVRGEAYLCALAVYRTDGTIPKLTYLFYREATDEAATRTEVPTAANLSAFLDKCLSVISRYAAPALDRAKNRIPSFRTQKFPFPKMREGQDAFMSAVYRTVVRSGKLYAEAPTGTGKTVCALYPAVRAMGEGKGEKIFYLTPKTTVSATVANTVLQMKRAGADLLSVIVIAKEKTCECGLSCKKSKELCAFSVGNHMADAVLSLFNEHLPVVGTPEIQATAKRFSVCPYEFSLCYARLADIVICDYNYLFDPFVYFHRFFDAGGDYIFLIDEAHVLAERAAAAYSDELSSADFIPDGATPELSPLRMALSDAGGRMKDTVFSYLKNDTKTTEDGTVIGASHGKVFPSSFYPLLDEIAGAAEKELYAAFADKTDAKSARVLAAKNAFYRFSAFRRTALDFDRRYEWFMFREGDAFRFKLYCVDPSENIARRLEAGRAAVFFSGTLSPISYYKTILGGGRTDETLTLPSPFVKEQLSVVVTDNIGTRLSERGKTLGAVLRVIAATLSAKRGHYMVFTPSFDYAEMLYKVFTAKYPKIRAVLQKRRMSEGERAAYLSAFTQEEDAYLIGFSVMGGLFSEGVDLAGKALIGSIVVGVGLPEISYEREAASAYYDEKYDAGKAFAYIYPGMNKVMQAAGRVIREETDRGVVVLIDDRFSDPVYKKAMPELWHGLKFVNDPAAVKMIFEKFWSENA